MPAWRSATSATLKRSSAPGHPGRASGTSGVMSERGSSHAARRATAAPAARGGGGGGGPPPPRRGARGGGGRGGPRRGPAVFCLAGGDPVGPPADVVESAAGRPAAEPGADLLELRGVERRAEAAEALA